MRGVEFAGVGLPKGKHCTCIYSLYPKSSPSPRCRCSCSCSCSYSHSRGHSWRQMPTTRRRGPKVLAAVKSAAFKLKLQAKQTAGGTLAQELGLGDYRVQTTECRLQTATGDWLCSILFTNEKRTKWHGTKTVPKHKFVALENERIAEH